MKVPGNSALFVNNVLTPLTSFLLQALTSSYETLENSQHLPLLTSHPFLITNLTYLVLILDAFFRSGFVLVFWLHPLLATVDDSHPKCCPSPCPVTYIHLCDTDRSSSVACLASLNTRCKHSNLKNLKKKMFKHEPAKI